MNQIQSREVVFFCSHFWPFVGGVETMVELIGKKFLQEGYKVTVCTLPVKERNLSIYNGLEILSQNADSFRDVLLWKCTNANVVSCILIQDPLGFIIWAAEGIPEKYRHKLIIQPIINDEGFKKWKENTSFRMRLKNLLQPPVTVVALTQNGADTVYFKESDIKYSYIPNFTGKETPKSGFRERFGIKQNEFVILQIANLFKVKNHIGLIEAIGEIPGDWRLVFAGNPNGEPEYVQTFKKVVLSDSRLIHIEGLDRVGVMNTIAESDIVVLPSLGEGAPVSLLEAMSLAKPWLATENVGGARLYLGGLIAHLKEFKGIIGYFRSNPEALVELGNVGQKYWMRFHSDSIVAKAWIQLVEFGETRLIDEHDIDDLLKEALKVAISSILFTDSSHLQSCFNLWERLKYRIPRAVSLSLETN
jgi:glycosyltransferase involved in cell wall biosynthesis